MYQAVAYTVWRRNQHKIHRSKPSWPQAYKVETLRQGGRDGTDDRGGTVGAYAGPVELHTSVITSTSGSMRQQTHW